MARCTARSTLLTGMFTGLLFTTLSAQAEGPEQLAPQVATDGGSDGTRTGIWPPDCTRDIPLDGLVLIDSATFGAGANTQVTLQPTNGATVGGAIDAAQSTQTLTVWQSAQPLLPNTEYKLIVTRDGSEPWLSHFTTGESGQQPLSFAGVAGTRVLPHPADDALAIVRIALPGLSGGLPHLPVHVQAALTDTRAELPFDANTSDSREVATRTSVGLEIEVALGETAQSRCFTIDATPQLGGSITLNPQLCVEVPARATAANRAPAVAASTTNGSSGEDDEALASLVTRQSGLSEAEAAAGASADGCSVSASAPAAHASWLLVALAPLMLRRRARKLA